MLGLHGLGSNMLRHRRRFRICRLIAAGLLSQGCIKHGRSRPQTEPPTVYSLGTDRTRAVAAMVKSAVTLLPDERAVACVEFQKMHRGYYYMYRPSEELLTLIGDSPHVVGPNECPRSYGQGAFHVYDPNEPKPPPGWIDPFYVVIEHESYDGSGASAEISFRRPGVEYTNMCNARRVGQRDWIAICRGVSAAMLG